MAKKLQKIPGIPAKPKFYQYFGYISASNQSVCTIFSGNVYFYICYHWKLRKLKSDKIIFLTLWGDPEIFRWPLGGGVFCPAEKFF